MSDRRSLSEKFSHFDYILQKNGPFTIKLRTIYSWVKRFEDYAVEELHPFLRKEQKKEKIH